MGLSQETQASAIKSLESTLHKLSSAYASMTEKTTNTRLVKKRQTAVKVGLESLKNNWYGDDFCYDEPVIATAKNVLQAIIPSIEKQLVKAKAQSPQKH